MIATRLFRVSSFQESKAESEIDSDPVTVDMCAVIVSEWVGEYLCRPLAIKRGRPRCSYSEPAISMGYMQMQIIKEQRASDMKLTNHIFNLIETEFDAGEGESIGAHLKSILLVFPYFYEYAQRVQLSSFQLRFKSKALHLGKMIGFFEIDWRARGDFISIAQPLPILVIRNMIRGDDFFLKNNSEWLAAYEARFPGNS